MAVSGVYCVDTLYHPTEPYIGGRSPDYLTRGTLEFLRNITLPTYPYTSSVNSMADSFVNDTLSAAEKEDAIYAWFSIIGFCVSLIYLLVMVLSLFAPQFLDSLGFARVLDRDSDTASVEAQFDSEEDAASESDYDSDYYSEEPDHVTRSALHMANTPQPALNNSGPSPPQMKRIVGPSWFPLGLSYALESGALVAKVAHGDARHLLPTFFEFNDMIQTRARQLNAAQAQLRNAYNAAVDAQAEIARLNAIIAQNKDENSVASQQLSHLRDMQQQHLQTARADLQAYRAYMDECEATTKDLKYRNAVLNEKVKAFGEQKDDLADENDRLQLQVDDLRVSNEVLCAYNKDIEQRNQDLEQTTRDLVCRNEAIEHENVTWKATRDALSNSSEIDRLESELAALQERHGHVASENAALRNNLRYVHRMCADNARRATMCDNALRNAEAGLSDREEQFDVLESLADEKDELIAESIHRIAMLDSEIADNEREKLRLVRACETQRAAHATEMAVLRSKLAGQETACARLAQVAETQVAHISALRSEVVDKASELADKDKYIIRLVHEVEKQSATTCVLSNAHTSLATRTESWADKFNQLAWYVYMSNEAAKHAQWESGGFGREEPAGDEFEEIPAAADQAALADEVADAEGAQDLAATLVLSDSESDGETADDFEELALSDTVSDGGPDLEEMASATDA